MTTQPIIGQTITCAETGKSFVAAIDGCSTNYATDSAGNLFSDEGVDIRQRRELLDRSRPFGAYISGDGRSMTGWKGNVLGAVVYSRPVRLTRISYAHGLTINSYWIRDIHGWFWYGRGNPGMCITVRAIKKLPR